MPVISIYNNKGGVGKSTLTVGLAEFLAANRKRAVLVIDLDAQASSSGALLGRAAVRQAIHNKRTVAAAAGQILETREVVRNLPAFITSRPSSAGRGTALAQVDLLVPDKPGIVGVEELMRQDRDMLALRDCLKPALDEYDFVLIDLPGNIDLRNRLAVGALAASDFALIPVEPTKISLDALPDTHDLVQYARDLGRDGQPAIIGHVLNKTDRRREQYRKHLPPILEAADEGALPPVFDNIVPDTPALATAMDETQDFHTLKDRFATYYDHVRKVTRELEERCGQPPFVGSNGAAPSYGEWLRGLFGTLLSRKRRVRC